MGRPTNKFVKQHNDDSDVQQEGFTGQPDSSRIVFLHGEVNEILVANVIMQLIHLANQNHKPINLVVSTYGGSVDEMFSLYDMIKFLPCPVHTISLGKVMSAGVLLLASGVKGKRMIGKNARVMIHSLSGGSGGTIFDIVNAAKELERMHELLIVSLAKETKMNNAEIKEIMNSGHDYFLTAKEALKLGIADIIIGDT